MRHLGWGIVMAVAACSDPPEMTPRPLDSGVVRLQDAGRSALPDAVATRDAGGSVVEDGGDVSDAGAEVDAGVTPPADAGAPPPPARFKRFVAIGDVGEGNAKQHRVAESIERVCAELGGCDFGMLLGDNHYDSGVDGADDPLWARHFELPYGGVVHECPGFDGAEASHDLGFPFYAVLGNHDLGGDGLGLDLDIFKADHQIAYGQRNPQWIMPNRYYQQDLDPVYLLGLNTTAMFFDRADDQAREVRQWIDDAPEDRWSIAFGHHPYISNGPHGNAGDYERIPEILQRITPNWTYFRGAYVQRFMEEEICERVDVYLAGHDHSRQDLGERCGTQFLVSGAGAKTTDLRDGDNQVPWEADTEGFLLMEATPEQLVFRMYDIDGVLEHERVVRR